MKLRALVTKRNVVIVLAVCLVTALSLAYPCRGFIRNTVLPTAAQVLYGPSVNKTTENMKRELQSVYPFGQIKYIDEGKTNCQLSDAHRLKTEVYCSTYLFRGQVSIKGVSVDNFDKDAKLFEYSLRASGWTPTGSNTGVNRSYDPPYGWWYLAEYGKSDGKVQCHFSVQRDNDPDLLDVNMGCDRRVIFF